MPRGEVAVLVVALVAPVLGVLILGYRATRGSQRADSILRWSTLAMYGGIASVLANRLAAADRSEAWSGLGLIVLILSFAASAISRSFSGRLGQRRTMLIFRNAFAGQAAGAWICAVEALRYGHAIGVFLAIVAVSVGTVLLWITVQLTKVIAVETKGA